MSTDLSAEVKSEFAALAEIRQCVAVPVSILAKRRCADCGTSELALRGWKRHEMSITEPRKCGCVGLAEALAEEREYARMVRRSQY